MLQAMPGEPVAGHNPIARLRPGHIAQASLNRATGSNRCPWQQQHSALHVSRAPAALQCNPAATSWSSRRVVASACSSDSCGRCPGGNTTSTSGRPFNAPAGPSNSSSSSRGSNGASGCSLTVGSNGRSAHIHHLQQQQQLQQQFRQQKQQPELSLQGTVSVQGQQLSGGVIMQQLKATVRWQQLQHVVEQHEQQLNWRHSSAAITHLAQLVSRQPLLLQPEQQQQTASENWACPQQSAVATLLQSQQQQQQQQRGDDRQQMAGSSIGGSLQQFIPRTLLPLLVAHLPLYDARGLANCVWALGKLQPLVQVQDSRPWLAGFCSASQPLLAQFDAQQLSNSLWGLVQLQHRPAEAWMTSWYQAMSKACRAQQQGWQPQSVSSALWCLAQLYGGAGRSSGTGAAGSTSSSGVFSTGSVSSSGSSSKCGPSRQWLNSMLSAAITRLHAGSVANSHGGSEAASAGQGVSNLVWSCAQLQHMPSQQVLEGVLARLQQAAAANSTAADFAGGLQSQSMSDQALANCMWALAKLQQQEQDKQLGGSSSSNCQAQGSMQVLQACGTCLLTMATGRVAGLDNRHLPVVVWSAGVLHLQPGPSLLPQLAAVLAARAGSFSDQQLAMLLWGLSWLTRIPTQDLPVEQQQQRQQQETPLQQHSAPEQLQQQQQQQQQMDCCLQPSQPQQQQPQHSSSQCARGLQGSILAPAVEQLLSAQLKQLPSYSTQAVSGGLLSLGRMQHVVSEPLLQAWLKELARRNYASNGNSIAMADAVCGLALLRRHQAAATAVDGNSGGVAAIGGGSTSSSWGSRGGGSSWVGRTSPAAGFGARFSTDAEWLAGFCSASIDRLASFTSTDLCRVAWALTSLQFRPPFPWLLSWQAAVAQQAGSMSGASAAQALQVLQLLSAASGGSGQVTTPYLAAEAGLLAAVAAQAAAGQMDSLALAVAAAACTASGSAATTSSSNSRKEAAQQVCLALVRQLSSCYARQVIMLATAAVAAEAPLPRGTVSSVLQRVRELQQGGCLSSSWEQVQALVAVAKLQGLQARQHLQYHHQQQHDQQQQPLQQQHEQEREQRQQEQALLLRWLQQTVPALHLSTGSAAELSMVLWALAVLTYRPPETWLQAWQHHSLPRLQQLQPQQLASCGWALAVLRCRPHPQWLGGWCAAVAAQAAATKPRHLALLLYSSAVMAGNFRPQVLQQLGVLAARQVTLRQWSLLDLAQGLWGLARLGLRGVADVDVLEQLLDYMVEVTSASSSMAQLRPYHQLQLLQAAVMLGRLAPTAAASSAAAAVSPVAATSPAAGRGPPGSAVIWRKASKQKLRWLRFRANVASQQAHAAVATATTAASSRATMQASPSIVMQQQQQQKQGPAVVPGQLPRLPAAAALSKAALVTAKHAAAQTGRDPVESLVPVIDPRWLKHWCRCSLQQLQHWRPQQLAAALSAFAALGWQPPLLWQQQVLAAASQSPQLSVPGASAIADALAALESPLKSTWVAQLSVVYVPRGAAAAAADGGEPSAAGTANVQQGQGQGVAAGLRRQQLPRIPQQLQRRALIKLHRQQRLVRLVGWWRRQQLALQQQHHYQRLQQQKQLRNSWRSATAVQAAQAVWQSQGSTTGGTAGMSVDIVTPLADAPAMQKQQQQPGSQPRQLSSRWQRQLLQRPVRPGAISSTASTGTSASSSSGNSSGISSGSVTSTMNGSSGVGVAVVEQASSSAAAASGAVAASGSDVTFTHSNSSDTTSTNLSSSSNGDASSSSSVNGVCGDSAAAMMTCAGPGQPQGAVQVVAGAAAIIDTTVWGSWAASSSSMVQQVLLRAAVSSSCSSSCSGSAGGTGRSG